MTKFILAGLMAAFAIAGSASAASNEAPDENKCLRSSQIDGFKSATRDSVVLTDGGREWRVDTMGACTGLNWANTIATKSRTMCFSSGDTLIFNDGAMRQTCMVQDVTYLPKEAKKADK